MDLTLALLIGSLLLLLGVLASKLSTRLGVPALLLFLGIGMLAGSEGIGGIVLDQPRPAMLIGIIALSLILFDGGLHTDLAKIDRPMIRSGILLSTIGVALTALVIGAFGALALGADWLDALLLGAVLSSTDAAAVFAVLRARGLGLPVRLRSLLEFESGSNDPTAVLLTTTVIAIIEGTLTQAPLLPFLFVYRLAGGGVIGWLLGRALVWLLDRIDLDYDGLYPVLTLSGVGVIYGVSELVGGNGFMSVYVAGLTLAGRIFLHRNSLLRFHEGLAWLMQIAMFLILGLLAFPSELPEHATYATLVSIVLIVAARPAASFIALAFSGLDLREKLFVAWVGLRGAAPIILATFVLVSGVPEADTIFNTVFFVVIISLLVQGPTVGVVARRLGIAEPYVEEPQTPVELNAPSAAGLRVSRMVVAKDSLADGERLVRIGGPTRPLVILMRRGNRLLVPTGGSLLEAGDELFAIGDPDSIAEMNEIVTQPAE